MVEYIIYLKAKKAKYIMKDIYNKFLRKDELWHFNYYDGFIRLKVTISYQKLDDYILKHKWRWEKNPYNERTETMPLIQRNFHTFCKMFNCFAVLLMEDSDHVRIADRVLHIFLNMKGSSYQEEANLLASFALSRMRLDGLYKGIAFSKDGLEK